MNERSPKLDTLSSFERKYVEKAKQITWFIIFPLVRIIASVGIIPNVISLAQIPISAITIFTISDYSKLSSLLFLITLLLDTLDGALAKYTDNRSQFGKVIDQSCDHFKEVLFFAALVLAGMLNPAWGLLYVFNHGLFNLVLYACNYFKSPLPFALKPSLIVYPLILAYLWWDKAWLARLLNYTIIISTLLMSLVIIQGFVYLQRAMNSK